MPNADKKLKRLNKDWHRYCRELWLYADSEYQTANQAFVDRPTNAEARSWYKFASSKRKLLKTTLKGFRKDLRALGESGFDSYNKRLQEVLRYLDECYSPNQINYWYVKEHAAVGDAGAADQYSLTCEQSRTVGVDAQEKTLPVEDEDMDVVGSTTHMNNDIPLPTADGITSTPHTNKKSFKSPNNATISTRTHAIESIPITCRADLSYSADQLCPNPSNSTFDSGPKMHTTNQHAHDCDPFRYNDLLGYPNIDSDIDSKNPSANSLETIITNPGLLAFWDSGDDCDESLCLHDENELLEKGIELYSVQADSPRLNDLSQPILSTLSIDTSPDKSTGDHTAQLADAKAASTKNPMPLSHLVIDNIYKNLQPRNRRFSDYCAATPTLEHRLEPSESVGSLFARAWEIVQDDK